MPWVHLHIDTNGLVKACCNANITFGNINEKTLQEIWNDEPIRRFRRSLLNGEKDKRCSSCYRKEASGKRSMRTETWEKFRHKKSWVEQTDAQGTSLTSKPIYFDIRFSNLCNLRCRTCWHGASSSWFEEAQALNNNLGHKAIIEAAKDSRTLLDQLAVWAVDVEEVYFAGGEPLMMSEHYDLLERLIEMGKTDVHLRYNTNLSRLSLKGRSVLDLWQQFGHVTILASIDGLEKRAEYIRKGVDWEQFVRNMERIANTLSHIKLEIAPTISVFNLMSLPEIHRYFVDKDLITVDSIYLNLLSRPDYYNIKTLPRKLKLAAERRIQKHIAWLKLQEVTGSLVSEFEAIIKFMNQEDWTTHIPSLKKNLVKLDQMRNESFEQTFPELAPIFDEA